MRTSNVATLNAAGVGSVTFTSPANTRWAVKIISVSTTSAKRTTATVTIGGAFVLATTTGNRDTASGQPLVLAGGETLTVTWTGGTPGAQATALIDYELTQGA